MQIKNYGSHLSEPNIHMKFVAYLRLSSAGV